MPGSGDGTRETRHGFRDACTWMDNAFAFVPEAVAGPAQVALTPARPLVTDSGRSRREAVHAAPLAATRKGDEGRRAATVGGRTADHLRLRAGDDLVQGHAQPHPARQPVRRARRRDDAAADGRPAHRGTLPG